jgi:DnaK suppressor protein
MKKENYIELKKELEDKKARIQKVISDNEKEMKALSSSDVSDEADQATISTDAAIEQAITNKQLKELKEIDYALFKMENKTYGVCEMCEESIGKERLKVKPQAKFCIVCREIVEKTS